MTCRRQKPPRQQLKSLTAGTAGGAAAYAAKPHLIREKELGAIVRWAKGQKEEALQLAKEAADVEKSMSPPSGPPDPIKPASELYGEMLLEAGRAKDAVQAFEAVVATDAEANAIRARPGPRRGGLWGFGDGAPAISGIGEHAGRLALVASRAGSAARPQNRDQLLIGAASGNCDSNRWFNHVMNVVHRRSQAASARRFSSGFIAE